MRTIVPLLLSFALAGCAVLPPGRSPELAPTSSPPTPEAPEMEGGPGGPGEVSRPRAGNSFQPYSSLISESAVSDTGFFKTHLVDGKIYFEIPREALGRDMLLSVVIAQNSGGSYGGEPLGHRIIRWELRGDKILVRSPRADIEVDRTSRFARAVEAASYPSILGAFDIKSWGPDSAAVIEMTPVFLSKSSEFGVRMNGNLARDRSFIERAAAFPENVEVSAVHTYSVANERTGPSTRSVVINWSMVALPEEPMKPRLRDKRVGYFHVSKLDFDSERHGANRFEYITRWRLECEQGESIPCEPVKPIIFYLDPGTPAKWVPYVKQGVEDWRDAFEEAGFRNAILAKDPPPHSDWSPEDARYSTIRWMPSPTENAVGPHINDPRTGEILVSDIMIHHNVLNLLRRWYLVQVGPLDERVRQVPMPDSLMGRLLQYVVAHEVGHALGLDHNMKSSSLYPADSLRSATFVKRMGHTPSLMDYARFNYVAQPEDSIPVELHIPGVGPYDRFAIRWGYRPVPDVKSAEEARSTLDEWAREQDEKPWLRFMTSGGAGLTAGELSEAVGDADPIYSTRHGIKNLRRVMEMLIPITVREGEDFSDLDEMYNQVVNQWKTELGHVVALIGKVEGREKYGGQSGVRFEPVPASRQREALAFLIEEAFSTPEFLLDEEILHRIEAVGALDRINRAQTEILSYLLYNNSMKLLLETEALADARGDRGEVYSLTEMLRDLRKGIWSELVDQQVRIDAVRRNLQHSYLNMADERVNAKNEQPYNRAPEDARALFRSGLRTLEREVERALPRTGDEMTRAHLEAVHVRITRILDSPQ